jgi:hypothetical protein
MNRLVKALLAEPSVVDRTTRAGRQVPFTLLRAALGDTLFSASEWESVTRNGDISQVLSNAYLPVISASDWETAIRLAEDVSSTDEPEWWTVMIPSETGNAGLTAPQNSADDEVIALFTGPLSNAQTIAYDPSFGSLVRAPTGHCSPPSWGKCTGGRCGRCKARLVWDPATRTKGIRCRCPDLVI